MTDDPTHPDIPEAVGTGAEHSLPVPGAPVTPDELFAVPSARPMPDELVSRIEAEIAAAANEASTGAHAALGRRTARWLAPLVAASLVAVLAGGVVAVQHDRHPIPAAPASTSTVTPTSRSSITPNAEQAERLRSCAENVSGGAATGGVWQVGGDIVLSHNDTYASLCAPTGEATSDGPGQPLPEQVQAFTLAPGYVAIAAGGRLPSGVTSVTIDNQEAVVNGGWWLWQRRLAVSNLRNEPQAREILLQLGKGQSADVRLVTWPGGATGILGHTGAAAVAACRAEHEASWAALAPDQRTVLMMSSQWGVVLCHEHEASMSGAGVSPLDESESGLSEETNSYTTAASGTVPAGAHAVLVTSALGEEKATISHGRWVWAHTVPSLDATLMPASFTVTFPGSDEAPQTIEGKQWTSDQVDVGTPFAVTGDELRQLCRQSGTEPGASVTSSGGHVMVVRRRGSGPGKGPEAIVRCAGADQSGVTEVSATAHLVAATFAVASVAPSPRSARLLVAGGALPKGVTSIVYQTPAGPVPATISGDLFAYEQFVSSASSTTPMPTAVVVRMDGQQRTIRL